MSYGGKPSGRKRPRLSWQQVEGFVKSRTNHIIEKTVACQQKHTTNCLVVFNEDDNFSWRKDNH